VFKITTQIIVKKKMPFKWKHTRSNSYFTLL